MDWVELRKKLEEPFSIRAIKFKPQTISKNRDKALMVAFIDARDVQDRLDSVVGPENWQFTVREIDTGVTSNNKIASVIGALSIFGVIREEVGEDSQPDRDKTTKEIIMSSYKSAVSDALKRCAVQFGVFRYAYSLDQQWTKSIDSGGYKFESPILPYWALAHTDKICEVTGNEIPETVVYKGKKYNGAQIICKSFYKYDKILCFDEYLKLGGQ